MGLRVVEGLLRGPPGFPAKDVSEVMCPTKIFGAGDTPRPFLADKQKYCSRTPSAFNDAAAARADCHVMLQLISKARPRGGRYAVQYYLRK